MAEYYYLDPDGQSVRGPFSLSDIWSLHNRDRINSQSSICQAGTEDWRPLTSFPELCPPEALSVTTSPGRSSRPTGRSGEVSPSVFFGVIFGAIGVFFILYFAVSAENHRAARSPYQSSTAVAAANVSPSHGQREAETARGFQEGRRIGNRRFHEGFPRPSLAYLDSILAAVNADQSEAWKLGFKGGYLSAWENHGNPL